MGRTVLARTDNRVTRGAGRAHGHFGNALVRTDFSTAPWRARSLQRRLSMSNPSAPRGAVERPLLVWLGPPRVGVQAEVATVFDVSVVSGLPGALKLLRDRAPSVVVGFLEACDHPPEFVHLLLTREIAAERLIYVWPAALAGVGRFRRWTSARVLPAAFDEEELLRAVRSAGGGSFSPVPVPIVRPRGSD